MTLKDKIHYSQEFKDGMFAQFYDAKDVHSAILDVKNFLPPLFNDNADIVNQMWKKQLKDVFG